MSAVTGFTGDAVIAVRGLTKRFGDKTVVDDFSMRVGRGQIYGFLGPNGSGKTTTIRMLCGLLTPDGGEGSCLGYDIRRDAAAIKREVGYMTQRFGLYEDLSIAENLDFVARVYGVPDRKEKVAATLDRLGLGSRRDQLAGSLSGGWKQRLALASCLMHEPKLLLLDEPTAGVDPKARRDFWQQIHELAADGLTVLISTHYMDEAERCHRLAYIAYGKLLVEGEVGEVIRQSGLSTWEVAPARAGLTIGALSPSLAENAAAEVLVPFGNVLHVSGRDRVALEAAVGHWRADPGWTWREIAPTLEDVFIALMRGAPDHY
ncbi:ABC transporter ATP-binding protein [Crenobacter cavernae]|nr:ABC transporter ATP-binding protein [Crenobacter cavernae]